MESLSRGWTFLKQAWNMAMADKDLIKPSIYALFVGFIVTLIGLIPFGIAAFLFQNGGTLGNIIYGVLGAIMVFAQYSVTYVFSAMTVYLIYGYLAEGDGQMEKAWAIVKRDWLDILSLAGASTLVNILKNIVRGNARQRNFVRDALANLIETVWTEATFLILPAMVIEDINLKDGIQRATYIVKNNLLLVGLSTVGVRWVTGLIGFGLGLIGILLGIAIAYPIITISNGAVVGVIIGVGLGVLVAMVFIMVASVINAYTSTAYHTCLYLWARDAERAQQAGNFNQIPAPAPLAAAMGR
jgi:uncharacterized protein DUF6159